VIRSSRHSRISPLRVVGVAAVFGTLLLSGCGKSDAELRSWVAQVKARPGPPLEPLPVMQQFETFEYSAQDLRDPFSPPNQEAKSNTANGPRPDPNRRKEQLEAYPLDSLDMVGTLNTGTDRIALIMDPDRVVTRVRPGNYMGQSDGRIKAIFEDHIELVELVPDGAGGWIERQASVSLDDQ